ncbi:MAG: hypothetical protein B7733_03885 [Myxococcales bacterium FL481]|nr:MAG: hypothetical protein B7733_03885 [Myxococcales bacterium FL481]
MVAFARILVILAIWLGLPEAAGGQTVTRTSVVPSAGSAVGVGDRTMLSVRVEGRQVVADATDEDTGPGFAVASGVHLGLTSIVGLSLGYGYARGVFPVEGLARQEHDVVPTLSIGRHSGSLGRLGISSRTKAELRILQTPALRWQTFVRPREELVVTLRVRPWLQASLVTEALLQPSHPIDRLVQLRAGPAFHGVVPLRRNAAADAPRLSWFAGAAAGFWPIELARAGRVQDLAGDATSEFRGQTQRQRRGLVRVESLGRRVDRAREVSRRPIQRDRWGRASGGEGPARRGPSRAELQGRVRSQIPEQIPEEVPEAARPESVVDVVLRVGLSVVF